MRGGATGEGARTHGDAEEANGSRKRKQGRGVRV